MQDDELFASVAMELSRQERALVAVLLFHDGVAWDVFKRGAWLALTGETEATTKVLCNTVRKALGMEEKEV